MDLWYGGLMWSVGQWVYRRMGGCVGMGLGIFVWVGFVTDESARCVGRWVGGWVVGRF